ncbi:MAG: TIM barrel protein [Candidatus Nanohaloarchaea archaeon]
MIGRGENAVLDVAHLYIAENDFYSEFERILDNEASKAVHLCDSTKTKDGLGFGDGELDMKKVCKIIDDSSFNSIFVLEVMPEDQKDALEKWNKFTG